MEEPSPHPKPRETPGKRFENPMWTEVSPLSLQELVENLSTPLVSDMLLPVSCLVEPTFKEKKNMERDLCNPKNDMLELSKGEKELFLFISNKAFEQKMDSLTVDEIRTIY